MVRSCRRVALVGSWGEVGMLAGRMGDQRMDTWECLRMEEVRMDTWE